MTLHTGKRGSGLSITRQEPGHRRGTGTLKQIQEIVIQRLRQQTTGEDTCEGLYTTQEGRSNQGLSDKFEAPSQEGTWKGFSSGTPGGDGEQPPHPSTEVDLSQEFMGQFGHLSA
jgi:hypothetical protein